jgi:hypothetical protein
MGRTAHIKYYRENYPDDYLYYESLQDFQEEQCYPSQVKNKKVLFVFGDSWTNLRYLPHRKNDWCYLLKQFLGYDYVISVSNDSDSNYNIFDTIKRTLCGRDFPMRLQKNWRNGPSEFKVIIGWSTPLRDSTSVADMYSPYSISTIPNLRDVQENTRLFMKYTSKWLRPEVYSFDTQKRILFLQEFFEYNKIDWYSFMAFTPLVENNFKDTPYDLRKWINPNRFFGLYDYPSNMQDYLISKVDSDYKKDASITEQQFYSKKQGFKFFDWDDLDRRKYWDKEDKMFTEDGHPAEMGVKLIYQKLKELCS